MKYALAAVLLSTAPVFADCPPLPDRAEEKAVLMEAMRTAPNEMSARGHVNALWEFWATAPNATAQELLDEGMKRRAAFDFDAAADRFDALIAYCPDYAEGWNQRAFIHFLREEYPAALEDLEKALEISPDHIAALAGLALTLDRLGRDAAAQSTLRAAVKLNPWLPERHMIALPPEQEL